MGSSLRKYLIKLSVTAFTVCALAVSIATVALNIVFSVSKKSVILSANSYFSQKISIAAMFYVPPNYIVLRDVSVAGAGAPVSKEAIVVPAVWARCSLKALILKRAVLISSMSLYRPRMNYFEFYNFLRNNFEQIMEFIRNLPEQDFRLSVRETALDLAQDDAKPDYVNVNAMLGIRRDAVWGFASLSRDLYSKAQAAPRRLMKGAPLQCNFNGVLRKDGFSLGSLECMKENLYSKLWGEFDGNTVGLKGFAFINTAFEERFRPQPAVGLFTKISSMFRQEPVSREVVGLSRKSLYLLDINCRLTVAFPGIQIDRLTFSLNNTPVSLKGSIVLTDPVSLELSCASSFGSAEGAPAENTNKLRVELKGALKNRTFNGNASLNLDLVSKKKDGIPVQKMEVGLKELIFYFDEYPRLKFRIGEVSGFFQTSSNEYRILLEQANGVASIKNEHLKFIKFNSRIYDGFLEGQSRIDITQSPVRILSVIRVRNVSAHRLEGLLVHFSKLHGRLASSMYFSNYPRLYLDGGMMIHDGYLYNFEFFKWLADLFNLPSLKKIDFSRVSSRFLVNTEGASLYGMALDSPDVNLHGYFSLRQNDLVNSRIALSLNRELLKQSPKFTPLLKLLREDSGALEFDFRLSGNLHGMNFQWLQSDFKRRLQEAIPGFIQRKLERGIEDIIESISAQ